jgi:glycerophosphoryl diester phosphodiesterase
MYPIRAFANDAARGRVRFAPEMSVPFLRVAHRGFAAVAEENSIAAIKGALAMGCDEIELDVRRSMEGRIVLHHNDGNAPGAPLLRDALEVIAETGAGIMLDLKQGGMAEAIAAMLDELANGRKVIASGASGEVLRLKTMRPHILAGRSWPPRTASGIPLVEHTLGAVRRAQLPGVVDRLLTGFDLLVAHHRSISPRVVAACHVRERLIYAWTIDDPRRIERLGAWGVDGVISDHPSSFGLAHVL